MRMLLCKRVNTINSNFISFYTIYKMVVSRVYRSLKLVSIGFVLHIKEPPVKTVGIEIGRINGKKREKLIDFIGQTYLYPYHMAWSGKDLQSLCQEAITYLDAKLLKPDREHHLENQRIIKQEWHKMKEDEKKR